MHLLRYDTILPPSLADTATITEQTKANDIQLIRLLFGDNSGILRGRDVDAADIAHSKTARIC